MFGADPIDFFDPSPYGALAYYGHYLFGSIALLSALAAFFLKKGRGLHRTAGLTFMATCAVLTLTSIAMLAVNFIPPLALATVTAVYALGGGYLALQAAGSWVKPAEYGLFCLEAIALVVFLSFAIPAVQAGVIPPVAPLVIAIVPLILLSGDLYWFANAGRRRQLRVARHLSRMIWAFVVVLRAPIVEIAAAGVPIPTPVAIVGPLVLAVAMLWYFQRKYGGLPFGARSNS